MTCPCKDCEFQGCGPYHDRCPKYKEWSERMQEEKAYRKKMNETFRKKNRPRPYW